MHRILTILAALLLAAPARAVTDQYYVDMATEYINRGNTHLKRFIESGKKNEREYALHCRNMLLAIQELDQVDDVNIALRRYELASISRCAHYWPTKYGGICEYDYANTKCKARKFF